MKRMLRVVAGFAALGIAISACGDEGGTGTNSGDPLTTTESLAVFGELQSALSGVLAPPRAAVPVDGGGDCPGGGSISISGDVSTSGQSGVTFDITETINNCVVSTGGVAFTVSGDPNIRIQGDIDINQTTFETTGTYSMTGGFSYTADDGRAGSCAININFDYGNLSVSGSVCGNSLTT